MIVACPYCAGVIVLDERKVTAVATSQPSPGDPVTVAVTFLAGHRCAPGARPAFVRRSRPRRCGP